MTITQTFKKQKKNYIQFDRDLWPIFLLSLVLNLNLEFKRLFKYHFRSYTHFSYWHHVTLVFFVEFLNENHVTNTFFFFVEVIYFHFCKRINLFTEFAHAFFAILKMCLFFEEQIFKNFSHFCSIKFKKNWLEVKKIMNFWLGENLNFFFFFFSPVWTFLLISFLNNEFSVNRIIARNYKSCFDRKFSSPSDFHSKIAFFNGFYNGSMVFSWLLKWVFLSLPRKKVN